MSFERSSASPRGPYTFPIVLSKCYIWSLLILFKGKIQEAQRSKIASILEGRARANDLHARVPLYGDTLYKGHERLCSYTLVWIFIYIYTYSYTFFLAYEMIYIYIYIYTLYHPRRTSLDLLKLIILIILGVFWVYQGH